MQEQILIPLDVTSGVAYLQVTCETKHRVLSDTERAATFRNAECALRNISSCFRRASPAICTQQQVGGCFHVEIGCFSFWVLNQSSIVVFLLMFLLVSYTFYNKLSVHILAYKIHKVKIEEKEIKRKISNFFFRSLI